MEMTGRVFFVRKETPFYVLLLPRFKFEAFDYHSEKQPMVTMEGVVALLLLLILSLAALVYHLIRIQYNEAVDFSMDWNLFLSWIPLLVAYLTRVLSRGFPKNYLVTLFLSVVWLLFFPNAPYMITDLIHLSVDTGSNVTWHDTIMLFYYAQVSLINGLISLYWIHKSWLRVFGRRWGNVLLLFSLPLAGFGIFLGRIERLNSWDILHNPTRLVKAVLTGLGDRTAVLLTFEFALLLGMLYLVLWVLLHFRLRRR